MDTMAPAPITPADRRFAFLEDLPFPIDDLSEEMQASTRLPASFLDAFQAHYGDALQAIDDANGRMREAQDDLAMLADSRCVHAARAVGLVDISLTMPAQRGGILAAEQQGWYLTDLQKDQARIERLELCGGELAPVDHRIIRDTGAVADLQMARTFTRMVDQIDALARIEKGEEMPWSFLPATDAQVETVRDTEQRLGSEADMIRHRIGDATRFDWLSSYDGMSEEAIVESFQETMQKVTRLDGTVEYLPLTADGEPVDALSYTEAELAEETTRWVEHVRRARLERGRARDVSSLRERLAQIDDEIEAARQSLGWPGGGPMPQQLDDGLWVHQVDGRWVLC